MIALVDCNNFYVSCERVFNPLIHNKPVVVLSNNDGCIISRSNEAKILGIKMGEPVFKKMDMLKENDVHVFSTNFALYGDLSNRVMSILSQANSKIEIYSIDEAFLDFSKINQHMDYAKGLRKKIKKWTGIPVSIGIARTKTLAKIANVIAKTKCKEGIFKINDSDDVNMFLKEFPVSQLWGVGEGYSRKLNLFGINSAYQLIQRSDNWIRHNMSIMGLKMVKELRGIPCFRLKTIKEIKKTISVSRTFSEGINLFKDLSGAVSTYAAICGSKLRKQRGYANAITVFIHTNPFEFNSKYRGIKKIYFHTPTNDSLEIISTSILALKNIYRSDRNYKRAGVILSEILLKDQVQLYCFDNMDDIGRRNRIMNAIDVLNKKHGRLNVYFAINGFRNKWKPKQSFLSPRYTTNIDELFQVATQ